MTRAKPKGETHAQLPRVIDLVFNVTMTYLLAVKQDTVRPSENKKNQQSPTKKSFHKAKRPSHRSFDRQDASSLIKRHGDCDENETAIEGALAGELLHILFEAKVDEKQANCFADHGIYTVAAFCDVADTRAAVAEKIGRPSGVDVTDPCCAESRTFSVQTSRFRANSRLMTI